MTSWVRIVLWGVVIATAPSQISAQQPQLDPVQRTCVLPSKSSAELELKYQSCTTLIERKDQHPAIRSYAFTTRGWIDLGRNNFLKAIDDFDAALALNSNFDGALMGRAIAFLNSQQSEKAIPDFDRLIAQHPTDPKLYVGRGDAYNNLKQYDKGVADFDHALALDPKDEEAMNDRAWALARQRKLTEAILGYDAALAVTGPMQALILANRCEAKAMARDVDGALADCDSAIKLEATNASHRATRGFANLSGKRFAAAVADYDTAFATDPTNPFMLYGRGIARLALGQVAEGQGDIDAALKLRPTVREDMAELGISGVASP